MLLLLVACFINDEDVDRALDPDGDGFGPEEDCAPMDPVVYPGAEEVCGDGVVNDCNMDEARARARCALTRERSLAQADIKMMGEEAGAQAGHVVASAGDVDGDGRADVLIGAPYQGDGGPGAAYLLLSSRSLLSNRNMDLGTADLKLKGETEGSEAGFSLASAGDVDGDGRADVLVGMPFQEHSSGSAGGASLFLSSGSLDTRDPTLAMSSADFVFVGEESYDAAGYSVSSAGDVDGDGHADLLFGAYGQNTAGEGAAYVVLSGGLLSAGKSALNLRLANLKILGEQEGGAAGMSVSSAGDIDGDGRGDLLVGAPQMSAGGVSSGAAYLLLTSGALSSMSSTLSLSAADLILVGEDSDDQAGTPVSSAGDADGDGYSDVLVGVRAVRQEGGDARDDAGYLLLSSGVLSEVGPTLGLAAADVKFVGDEGKNSGYSIASAGDVDADGHSDVLVGADLSWFSVNWSRGELDLCGQALL